MLDHESFQGQVLTGLSELKTMMTSLVGVDQGGGRVKALEKDVDSLKLSRSKERGFAVALVVVWTLLSFAADYLIHKR